jgi:hypothetical protein
MPRVSRHSRPSNRRRARPAAHSASKFCACFSRRAESPAELRLRDGRRLTPEKFRAASYRAGGRVPQRISHWIASDSPLFG